MTGRPPLAEIWHRTWSDRSWAGPLAWWQAWAPGALPVGGSDFHGPGDRSPAWACHHLGAVRGGRRAWRLADGRISDQCRADAGPLLRVRRRAGGAGPRRSYLVDAEGAPPGGASAPRRAFPPARPYAWRPPTTACSPSAPDTPAGRECVGPPLPAPRRPRCPGALAAPAAWRTELHGGRFSAVLGLLVWSSVTRARRAAPCSVAVGDGGGEIAPALPGERSGRPPAGLVTAPTRCSAARGRRSAVVRRRDRGAAAATRSGARSPRPRQPRGSPARGGPARCGPPAVSPEDEASWLVAQASTPAGAGRHGWTGGPAASPLEHVLAGWSSPAADPGRPGVFVPRRRTELLVRIACTEGPSRVGRAPVVVELCCGAGAVGAALAHALARGVVRGGHRPRGHPVRPRNLAETGSRPGPVPGRRRGW